MGLTWQPWTSVSEGSSTPGAPVAAVPWGQSFALFIADPGGGVYAIKADPGFGWELVPGRSTKPGAQITAVPSGNRFTLFMADVNGEVFTTSGIPYQGWDPWTSVSEGSSTPGAPVAAVPWGQSFALFIADPGGGVYAIKAEPGFGWELVPGRSTKPGAQVTALPWYKPPKSDQERFLLFMADVNGTIYTTSGIPYQGWDPWTNVPEGSSTPGARVTAVPQGQRFALFIADPGGGVRNTSSSDPPATPENLRVTSVTVQTIDVSWSESNPVSIELDGFIVCITNITHGHGTNCLVHGPADRTASFTGLQSGVEYEIQIDAFNANGYSISNVINVTTPVVVVEASVEAEVVNIDVDGPNVGLSIRGANFQKGELIAVHVDWTVGPETATYQLTPTADSTGAFVTIFAGSTPFGFCPIDVAFGMPQPPQTFHVTAGGTTSNKTASTTAGPFTCPP
jgi:Fibronectin type III domain